MDIMMTKMDPMAVRVWVGYSKSKQLDDFKDKLQRVFIPVTWQWMAPLGGTAYIPTLIRPSKLTVPNEIALVFYRDQDVYDFASKETPTGRAYGLLHSTIFKFDYSAVDGSFSQWPVNLPNDLSLLKKKTPYLLSPKLSVDWHSKLARVEVRRRDTNDKQSRWLERVKEWAISLTSYQNKIAAYLVFDSDYLCFWVIDDRKISLDKIIPDFGISAASGHATVAEVPIDKDKSFKKVTIKYGQSLNLRFK